MYTIDHVAIAAAMAGRILFVKENPNDVGFVLGGIQNGQMWGALA